MDASIDEIIAEAQKAEEILYRRNRDQRRLQYLNQISPMDDKPFYRKGQSEYDLNQREVSQNLSMDYPITGNDSSTGAFFFVAALPNVWTNDWMFGIDHRAQYRFPGCSE